MRSPPPICRPFHATPETGRRRAVELQQRCRAIADGNDVPSELLALDSQVTDCNAAVFDVANDFRGCIPGCHEILRRQGLLAGKEDEIFPALEALARSCIKEDGADVILLGSTTMHQAHGFLAERLPVPVINPGPLSYKLAEAALGLGLTHSRVAYPVSPAPMPELLRAMLDAAGPFEH